MDVYLHINALSQVKVSVIVAFHLLKGHYDDENCYEQLFLCQGPNGDIAEDFVLPCSRFCSNAKRSAA